jgi:serine protease Do
MNKRITSRTLLTLATCFVIAFAGTTGLTLCAADHKTAAKKSDQKDDARGKLVLNVDRKPINRDGYDRVSYAPIVKKTAASVVYVFSSKKVPGQDLSPLLNDPLFRRFFEGPGGGGSRGGRDGSGGGSRGGGGGGGSGGGSRKGRTPDRVQQGLGSGVVITGDGFILTNNHVVEGADDVKVAIGDSSKRYEAKVVGRDALTDIAVLKIEATGLSPAIFGDSEQLQIGDGVLAIGNPFGVGQSVSRGIVSALGRGQLGIEQLEDFIQVDAAINPGNSGGALLDSDGRLVGINTAILSGSGGFAGVGFAIPINLVRSVAEQIVNKGRVDRGYLGIFAQDLSEELAGQFGTERGALVSEVAPDSPAEKAGLKSGDVIKKVDRTEIRDGRHLTLTVTQIAPETEVAVEFLRDGKTRTVTATLGLRPTQGLAAGEPGAKDEGVLNGVGVGEITPQLRTELQLPARVRGVIITSIEADSPSAKQGLREGDVILELNRKPIIDVEQAVRLSEEIKGPKVMVLIWREGRTRYLVIDESK